MPMPPIDMDAPAMIPHSSKLPYLGEMDLTNVTIAYRAGQMFLGMGIVQLNIAFSSGLPDLFFSTASSEDAFLSRLSTMEDNVLERRIELEGLRPVLNGGMRTSRVKLHRVSSSSTSTGRTTQSLKTAAMQNEDREYFATHSPSPRLVSITTYLCWASYQNVQTEIIDYLYRSKNVKVILAARRTGSSTISARTHIGHRRPETVTVVCTHLADKDINVFG